MKKIAALCTLAMLASPAFAADDVFQDVRFVALFGVTGGGDTIPTGYINSDGEEATLSAGGTIQIGVGAEWKKPEWPISVRGTINYHFDKTNADNGSVTFSRIPLELTAAYHIDEKFFAGGGLRFVRSIKYRESVSGYTPYNADFDPTTGLVLEAGYRFNKHFQASLRYVSEEYKVSNIGGYTFDGSHGGLFAAFVF